MASWFASPLSDAKGTLGSALLDQAVESIKKELTMHAEQHTAKLEGLRTEVVALFKSELMALRESGAIHGRAQGGGIQFAYRRVDASFTKASRVKGAPGYQ